MISLFIELPEALKEAIALYLDKNKGQDQDSLIAAAIMLYLEDQANANPS